MKSPHSLIAALLAIAWSGFVFADCNAGRTKYMQTLAGVPISCSQGSCHGPNPANNTRNIQNGAMNPSAIDFALDTKPEMSGLRTTLPLTAADIVNLSEWIFFAPTCPTAGPASLNATPASLTFATQTVNTQSAAQTITVTNTGGTAASGVSVSNSNTADFPTTANTCGVSLGIGASCNVSVAFKPTVAGARSGTVTVNWTGGSTGVALSGTGQAGGTAGQLVMPAPLNFGSQAVGTQSAFQNVTISNTGGTAVVVSSVASSNPAEFPVLSNTCTSVAAGTTCSVSFRFQPTATGARSALVTVTSSGVGSPQTFALSGTGTAAAAQGQLTLLTALPFGNQAVGVQSAALPVNVVNIGGSAVTVSSVSSSNPAEFIVVANSCIGSIAASGSCSIQVGFTPSVAGARSGTLSIVSNGIGSPQSVALTGTGTGGGTANTADVIEYFHASFGHYFVTAIADEISKIDTGVFVGWARTGLSFKVFTAPAPGLVAVCRFFSTVFAPKSSHFYAPRGLGCEGTMTNVDWGFEGDVFYVALPDAAGNCPANTGPVYRLYNNGQTGAPNHRFTTSLTVRAQMLAQNYVAEGAGIGVGMCAPL